MKKLPPEFSIPPQSDAALRQEAVRLVALCVAFIVVLGIILALTQGMVIQA